MIDTIIVGSLNTDLLVTNAPKLLEKNELTFAQGFEVAPGGKSRNITAMLATLQKKGSNLAFLGKTLKDKFGFWHYPINSLNEVGIDTTRIKVLESHPEYKYPALAIIPIDIEGQNQIYLVPNILNDFSAEDIRSSKDLFEKVGKNHGNLVLTLELPTETALAAIELAKSNKMKVFLDPGGIEGNKELINVVRQGGYLIKPNEYEAQIITGIEISDFDSARQAGKKLLELGFEIALITHGRKGAYLFGQSMERHIVTPEYSKSGSSVGCGDQMMAALVWALSQGNDVSKAAEIAIVAASLQFTKPGITPVTVEELEEKIN